jgi:hypothetical protein
MTKQARSVRTGYLGLYITIWEKAFKDFYKAQKRRLTRELGRSAKKYFPRLKKAAQRKIWREHEAWPENTREQDEWYEKEYQEILKEVTNDKERAAGNTEPEQGN